MMLRDTLRIITSQEGICDTIINDNLLIISSCIYGILYGLSSSVTTKKNEIHDKNILY